VRDDGDGFDAHALSVSPTGHMGLSSMRERAEMAGGWWRVESAPARGTTVECWIPGRVEATTA
jgi:signal transduction histidine kinase